MFYFVSCRYISNKLLVYYLLYFLFVTARVKFLYLNIGVVRQSADREKHVNTTFSFSFFLQVSDFLSSDFSLGQRLIVKQSISKFLFRSAVARQYRGSSMCWKFYLPRLNPCFILCAPPEILKYRP